MTARDRDRENGEPEVLLSDEEIRRRIMADPKNKARVEEVLAANRREAIAKATGEQP